MKTAPAFKSGELVQRVNNPESVGIIREPRWDEQTENWNYLVQFGSQLLALPGGVLQGVQEIESPWSALA
ncbi:MAG TPA: hypothetical protein VK117_13285, partial [Pyrinomonadaceae bacterium]|nr:hypothetical protein [Pyrinomonadaceae bacterium]